MRRGIGVVEGGEREVRGRGRERGGKVVRGLFGGGGRARGGRVVHECINCAYNSSMISRSSSSSTRTLLSVHH